MGPRRVCIGLVVLQLLLSATAFAQDEGRLDRIASSGRLKACIWPDYYGISYRDPRSMQLQGLEVDNARDLASELGVEVEFVDSSFARLIDDLESDRCDIATFAIGVTEQRQARLRFTSPHLVSDIYAITTKSNRRVQRWSDIDRKGTVVVVAKGTLHEAVMRARLAAAELRIVDSPSAREQEVRSGRADVFMTDYPFSLRMLDSNEWARVVAPDRPYHVSHYAWAMRQGDDRFHARVEQALAKLRADGRIAENARRHALEPIVAR